ncbi:MAG: hypothetical protein ACLQSR_01600 [Limisphaerales bacterium]
MTRSHFQLTIAILAAAITLTACRTPIAKVSSAAPCLAALDRFTAPDVPAMGPAEAVAPIGRWTNGVTPANLPGNGLAQHPMLYAGEGCNKMFLVNNGQVIWTYSTGAGYEYDDFWMLSNGNILFSRLQYLAEITPEKKVVWRYDGNNSNGTNHTEIHACEPIGLDRVLFVLNGLPPKLMIVNIKTGAVEVEHALPFIQPPSAGNIHGEFRRVRYTAQGTYLVPFLTMNRVVEYDRNFNEIWSYRIRSPWAAIRLQNGNTLITDEQDNLTREVNPKGETVWEFKNTDLPPEYRFAVAPQSCTRLANGDTIFCSRGTAAGHGPQLVEVTPDKKVAWVLQDWKTLGPATAVQILDDPGVPENPGEVER